MIRLQVLPPGGMKDRLVRFKFGKNAHELNWVRLSDAQRMLITPYGGYRLALPTASL